MASAAVERMVRNWRVKEDEIDSDHNIIICDLVLGLDKYNQPITRYNLSNINVEELTRQTDALLGDLERHLWKPTNEHIDFHVEALTTGIQRVMEAV